MSFYVEAVLGFNFLVDLVLLWLVGLGLGLPIRPGRLASGALAGSVYALVALAGIVPVFSSAPAKVLAASLMVYLAYRPRRLPEAARALGLLCLESMAAGGLVLALAAGTGRAGAAGGAIVLGSGARGLLPYALAGAGCLSYLCGGLLKKAGVLRQSCYRSTIVVGSRRATLQTLLDTGNELVDPITHRPVLVVEFDAVSDVLPPALRLSFRSGEPAALAAAAGEIARAAPGSGGASPQESRDESWDGRITVVPFRSVGSAGCGSGLLLGFRPDAVIVEASGALPRTLDGLLVAVAPGRLGTGGSYQGLLPASALT
jgi:stage II sporulation protein GA (sporulation sigma-E factor processing peptidase)